MSLFHGNKKSQPYKSCQIERQKVHLQFSSNFLPAAQTQKDELPTENARKAVSSASLTHPGRNSTGSCQVKVLQVSQHCSTVKVF